MEFEEIIPFLFVGAIILANVLKAVLSKPSERGGVERNFPPSNSMREDLPTGDDSYEEARRYVEQLKRARSDKSAERDLLDDVTPRSNRKPVVLSHSDEDSRKPSASASMMADYVECIKKANAQIEESRKALLAAQSKASSLEQVEDSFSADAPFVIPNFSAQKLRRRQYLREAFVMSEILSKPVALRDSYERF